MRRNSPPTSNPIDLLNTPLANAMKKVGMTPQMSGSLNSFVKKKVITSLENPNSNSTSPKAPNDGSSQISAV